MPGRSPHRAAREPQLAGSDAVLAVLSTVTALLVKAAAGTAAALPGPQLTGM
jgi:hypothetical protein